MPKFANLLESIISLIYPALCMHCGEFLQGEHKIFCESCFSDLELFSVEEERCLNCFHPTEGAHKTCKTCRNAIFSGLLAAFPLLGTAATFHSKLRSLYGSYLCKTASAYMAIQIAKSRWPLPDFIIAQPQSLAERFFDSHHFNAAIAKELAFLLNRPFINPFRLNVRKLDFSEIDMRVIKNKNLLLVADLLTQQSKMHEYAALLAKGYPKNLYGIALCQGI